MERGVTKWTRAEIIAPGRKVQREILRSEIDLENDVLVDFFTAMSHNHQSCIKQFFFVGNALFFSVQYPVMLVTQ